MGAATLRATQTRLLGTYLAAAGRSEFCARHGLTGASTIDEFRGAVPLGGYERLARDIERMRAGVPDVLFDGTADAYVKTGGTSGHAKVFPRRALLNREWVPRLIDSGLDNELRTQDHPELARGQMLQVAGTPPEPGAVGYVSGYAYALNYKMSLSFRQRAFLDPAWFEVLDKRDRAYGCIRLAAAAPIVFVAGPPYALMSLGQSLEQEADRLIRDVRDGTLSMELPPNAFQVLPRLAPDPERAARIERAAVANGGRLRPRDLWPDLVLTQTFMGGSLAQNRAFLRDAFGTPVREIGYVSTESGSALGFPVRDEDDNLVLAIHTAFYEFIDDDERAHLADEVTVGHTYRLAITSPHGLYRYDTRDFLTITGHDFDGAPVFRVVGRDKTSDLIGEKFTEREILATMKEAESSAGAPVAYTFVPRFGEGVAKPFYELLCAAPGPSFDRAAFERAVDAALEKHAAHYRVMLDLEALAPLRVRWVERAWFDALRSELLRERDFQAKLPVFLDAALAPPLT